MTIPKKKTKKTRKAVAQTQWSKRSTRSDVGNSGYIMPLIRYLTKHRMQLILQKKTKKRTNLGTATIRIVYTLRILGIF